jgi:hypothetical protein
VLIINAQLLVFPEVLADSAAATSCCREPI